MKKLFLLVSLILLYSNSLFSQQTVGVLDISPRQGVSEKDSEIVTDFVYTALYQYGGHKYTIISRQNRDAILAEHDFSLSGFCDEDSCALEVGKYLSADYVVIGTFTKFGSKYYLSLQLVDVNTTTVSGSARDGADDFDGIASTVVDNCVAELFKVENNALEEVSFNIELTETFNEANAGVNDNIGQNHSDILEKESGEWIELYKSGKKNFEEKQFLKAKEDFLLSLKLNPQNENTYLSLGYIYEMNAEFDAAILILKEGLKYAISQKSAIYFNLANIYFEMKDFEIAESIYTKCIDNDVNFNNAYLNRANTRVKTGDYILALRDYEHFLELVPEYDKRLDIEKMISMLKKTI